jgi:hypothetical protein
MLTSQHYRVTLQLLDAEQLRAQQLGIPVVAQRFAGACRNTKLFDDYDILLALARGVRCSAGLTTCVHRKLMPRFLNPWASKLSIAMILRCYGAFEVIKIKMDRAEQTSIAATRGQGSAPLLK